jgi:protoheme IX farnesyltransferase
MATYCSLGVFLLSAAACTANQIIERDYDQLMERTLNRPIPSGQISVRNALIIYILLFISGIVILFSFSLEAAILGVVSNIWYLGIYTLLKRKTPFATIPGAIVGALPFLIGWISAGGSLLNPNVIIIAFYLYMWQIPHFWLLMIIYGDDYEKAGFPSLQRVFNNRMLRLWTFMWILAAIIISLTLPYFKVVSSIFPSIFIFVLGIFMIFISAKLLIVGTSKSMKILFHLINGYMIGSVVLLILK